MQVWRVPSLSWIWQPSHQVGVVLCRADALCPAVALCRSQALCIVTNVVVATANSPSVAARVIPISRCNLAHKCGLLSSSASPSMVKLLAEQASTHIEFNKMSTWHRRHAHKSICQPARLSLTSSFSTRWSPIFPSISKPGKRCPVL